VELEKVLLSAPIFLGRDQAGLGLRQVGDGAPEIRRLEHAERLAFLHALPRLSEDLRDPTGHGREHMRDAEVVEGHASRCTDRPANITIGHGLDLDMGVFDLLLREPDLAGRWLLRGPGGG
jgi:hypothetical protein